MRNRSVLVVNERSHESDLIRKILMGEIPRTTVFIVNSGRRALDILLGGGSDILHEGVLPDAVIISDSVTDMKPTEIADIVTKYYRLRNIRFYLLSEIASQNEKKVPQGFAGYVQRPLADDRATRKRFLWLQHQLEGSGSEANIKKAAQRNLLYGF